MDTTDFYGERKWCGPCGSYVRFLSSVDHHFCAHCGSPVKLFSDADEQRFRATMETDSKKRRKLNFGGFRARANAKLGDSRAPVTAGSELAAEEVALPNGPVAVLPGSTQQPAMSSGHCA